MSQIHPEFANTEWHNPTKDTVTVQLHLGPGIEPLVVTIPPGQAAMIGTKFDRAIQRVKDGVVVGGHAPQLVRKGAAPMPIHQAIAEAARLGERERAMAAMTGVTGGATHLDMGQMLQSQIDEMRTELARRAATAEEHAHAAEMAAAEEAKRRAQAEEAAARHAQAAEAAAKAHAEANAAVRAKDAELEQLRRQLEELQTTPDAHPKPGQKPRT